MKQIIDTKLLQQLGLDTLPIKDQERLMMSIGDAIYDSIIARAIRAMNSKDKVEFEHMLADNPTFDSLGEFIYKAVPGIDKIAEEEIKSFQKIALETFQSAYAN